MMAPARRMKNWNNCRRAGYGWTNRWAVMAWVCLSPVRSWNYYRGEMGFDRSPQLGGFRVWVRLPDLSGSS